MKKANVLFLFLSFLSFKGFAQKEIRFERFGYDEGLSQSSVLSILQDKKGFIWVGTQDGLNRFDGYSFINFRNDSKDSSSFQGKYGNALLEDSEGVFWVGSDMGLNIFDSKSMTFSVLRSSEDNSTSLSDNSINVIFEDSKNRVWVGTQKGLNLLDKKTKTFTRFLHNPEDSLSLAHNSVRSITEDKAGNLWVGTNRGLSLYNESRGTFVKLISDQINGLGLDKGANLWVAAFTKVFMVRPRSLEATDKYADGRSIFSGTIRSMFIDSKDQVWLATDNGLSLIDAQRNNYAFHSDSSDPNSLSSEFVQKITEDRDGNLWVGTNAGLDFYDILKQRFTVFGHNPSRKESLSAPAIWSIFEDTKKNIWVGTSAGGLNKSLDKGKHFEVIPGLSGNSPMCLLEDDKKNLWVGTNTGISIYDAKSQKFRYLKAGGSGEGSLNSNTVRCFLQDDSKNIWVGTSNGLNLYNEKGNNFEHFQHNPENPNSISSNRVFKLFQDSKKNLWAAVYGGGLNRFDAETRTFERFMYDENDSSTLSGNGVGSIAETENYLWVATFGDGFNRYDFNTKKFKRYGEKDGLSNNVVYGILTDEDDNLWMSTNKGINKFDPRTETFTVYDMKDGLQNDEFNMGAYFRALDGKMYFGGVTGVTSFYPKDLTPSVTVPPVVLSDFFMFNKIVAVSALNDGEGDGVLKKEKTGSETKYALTENIDEAQELILDHTDAIFGFSFAALNYRQSEKVKYAYKLAGFDDNWVYTDSEFRRAVYTNIPHGSYTFQVKATNHEGKWGEDIKNLKITVLPPWWLSIPAKILYVILLIAGGPGIYFWRVNELETKQKALESLVAERTVEITAQNEELFQQKEEIMAQRDSIEVKNANLSEAKARIDSNLKASLSIQQSILPQKDKVEHIFGNNHFILYKPKDIVSGDFYWMKDAKIGKIMVASDCTGHGVSGAFMTLIGYMILRNIENKPHITEPGQILVELDNGVRDALKQENNSVYGMDASALIFRKEKGESVLKFSGAKSRIYKVSEGELSVKRGSNKAIGGLVYPNKKFENHTISIKEGDWIYAASDGYRDQNDIKRNGYGSTRFHSLLLEASVLPAARQKKLFEEKLEVHSAGTEQRDDILLIGLQV